LDEWEVVVSWFSRALDKAVKQGVDAVLSDYFKPGGGFDGVVADVVWRELDKMLTPHAKLTPLGFVWALRLCFVKHGSSRTEASDLANDTLSEYLADEKIGFGSPNYAWTREAAECVAQEYQLRFWEQAA
jgi:hypothetical protein